MARVCEVESGCSKVTCTCPATGTQTSRPERIIKHRLKVLNHAPNQTNPLSNSVIFHQDTIDIISASKFGGGGVHRASLSLLAGCGLLPNYIDKRHAALLLFSWRGYGSIFLPQSGGGQLDCIHVFNSIHGVSLLSLINSMATLVLVLNLCGLPRRALAAPTQAPTQNFTALRTDIAPPWVPDPDNRGTWSLLYSCVFTLVLCVWTAIHLNVPAYHESRTSQWLRKLKWVMLAIIAPELGVYTAYAQYFQAKNHIRQLDEISLEKETRNSYTTDQSETQLSHNSQV